MVPAMQTVAVVLAGGSGRRFGGSMPKQLRLLAGRTLLEHCVAAFDQAPSVDEVLVVTAEEFTAQVTAELGRYGKLAGVVAGGSARTDSTRQAIAAIGLSGRECNVLFHDAARPLVDQRIIADCVAALEPLAGHRRGRAVVRHDRGGDRRDARPGAAARLAGPLPDPAGLPAVGHRAGPTSWPPPTPDSPR